MKIKILTSCLTVILGLATIASAQQIQKLNLDDLSGLGLSIEKDSTVKAEGQGAVKIVAKFPAIVNLGQIPLSNIDRTKLVYRAKVKSQNLQGAAFLEMWCHFGDKQYFSRGMNSTVTGTSDWKILETVFMLKSGEKPDKVTLNVIIDGAGTVWVDDASVLKSPLP